MPQPARLVRRHGDLPLSGRSLTELLRAVLDKGKPFRFRARGLSMSPFIKDGDVVTVAPLRGATPQTGDIAAFLHPATGQLAIHRIVGAKSGRFTLKGDNAVETDGALPAATLLGLVTRVERNGSLIRPGPGGGAAIAKLSRSGLLRKAVAAARRAGVRSRRRP
jgi:phage repressor protein C with HTH and peptisase S24 domain